MKASPSQELVLELELKLTGNKERVSDSSHGKQEHEQHDPSHLHGYQGEKSCLQFVGVSCYGMKRSSKIILLVCFSHTKINNDFTDFLGNRPEQIEV
ncbi:hypothetical protein NDU88_003177 [Pleurodeles waltl]|uniref:Uncharacterized protein n=1 Tax=Pleurodeles waltl TaxID=8319 RepID=A0AAV7VCM6_PLEWA|nr:hypothetical protein NDU88_003177 [Pleurodeles waltl]